jgi:CRP-like cAMP-binding protein
VEVEIEMGVEEVSIGYEELRTSDTPGVRTSDPPGTPFALDPVRLHGLPLLGPLPSEVLSDFLQRIEYVKVAPGDRVVTQGDVADCVYLVVAGDLIVTRGAPARPIARLGEGAFFGEMALLDDAPRSASVVAVTDAELLRLPRDLVLEICDRYPHVLATLMQALRARLTTTLTNTLPIFAGIPVAERAALVERFRLRGIAAGTTVIREGQRADGLYVLLTGKADVIVRGAVIATLTTGDVAGEMSLLSHGTARATVKTRTSVTALVLPADDFQEIIMVHPQVLEQLVALSESREAALGGEPGGQEADVLDLGIGEEFELPRFEPPSVRRL